MGSATEVIYKKFRREDFEELMKRAEEFQKTRYARDIPEVVELCDGRFIG